MVERAWETFPDYHEEMILFTFCPDGRVVRQRGIADNLTALHQLGDASRSSRPDPPLGTG